MQETQGYISSAEYEPPENSKEFNFESFQEVADESPSESNQIKSNSESTEPNYEELVKRFRNPSNLSFKTVSQSTLPKFTYSVHTTPSSIDTYFNFDHLGASTTNIPKLAYDIEGTEIPKRYTYKVLNDENSTNTEDTEKLLKFNYQNLKELSESYDYDYSEEENELTPPSTTVQSNNPYTYKIHEASPSSVQPSVYTGAYSTTLPPKKYTYKIYNQPSTTVQSLYPKEYTTTVKPNEYTYKVYETTPTPGYSRYSSPVPKAYQYSSISPDTYQYSTTPPPIYQNQYSNTPSVYQYSTTPSSVNQQYSTTIRPKAYTYKVYDNTPTTAYPIYPSTTVLPKKYDYRTLSPKSTTVQPNLNAYKVKETKQRPHHYVNFNAGHQYSYAFFDDGTATVQPPKFTFQYDQSTPKSYGYKSTPKPNGYDSTPKSYGYENTPKSYEYESTPKSYGYETTPKPYRYHVATEKSTEIPTGTQSSKKYTYGILQDPDKPSVQSYQEDSAYYIEETTKPPQKYNFKFLEEENLTEDLKSTTKAPEKYDNDYNTPKPAQEYSNEILEASKPPPKIYDYKVLEEETTPSTTEKPLKKFTYGILENSIPTTVQSPKTKAPSKIYNYAIKSTTPTTVRPSTRFTFGPSSTVPPKIVFPETTPSTVYSTLYRWDNDEKSHHKNIRFEDAPPTVQSTTEKLLRNLLKQESKINELVKENQQNKQTLGTLGYFSNQQNSDLTPDFTDLSNEERKKLGLVYYKPVSEDLLKKLKAGQKIFEEMNVPNDQEVNHFELIKKEIQNDLEELDVIAEEYAPLTSPTVTSSTETPVQSETPPPTVEPIKYLRISGKLPQI